jgi:hypothetical protein
MSIFRLTSYFRFIFLLLGLQIFTEVRAQGIEVDIFVDASGQTAKISGRFRDGFVPANKRNVVFKKAITGNDRLAKRISGLELFGTGPVAFRRLMAGEYLAEADFSEWSYQIDLKPPADRAATAHASWIGEENGILMLDDLLPQLVSRGSRVAGKIRLRLPNGWSAADSNDATLKDSSHIDVDDVENSVIFVGRSLRIVDAQGRPGVPQLVLSGSWHFTDKEAEAMTSEIFAEYTKRLGPLPKRNFRIGILKFPIAEYPGHWAAETRGSTITILSSDLPFRTQSLQRLHEQLRHEIFHLWFPNGVNLSGDYGWFYEGFALYQSLKLGVRVNRIRFEDMLGTLARAYTIDANARPRLPLSGNTSLDPTVRYARGMLVAFLIDVEMLSNSKGKTDVTQVLGRIYRRYGDGGDRIDGNKAVIEEISQRSIIDNYVLGTASLEWAEILAKAGIDSTNSGRMTSLAVSPKLNGRQKEILDRLGYNNWRKTGKKR